MMHFSQIALLATVLLFSSRSEVEAAPSARKLTAPSPKAEDRLQRRGPRHSQDGPVYDRKLGAFVEALVRRGAYSPPSKPNSYTKTTTTTYSQESDDESDEESDEEEESDDEEEESDDEEDDEESDDEEEESDDEYEITEESSETTEESSEESSTTTTTTYSRK